MNKQQKPQKNHKVTKTTLYLRMAVAAYVVYLAYQLIPTLKETEGGEFIIFLIATIVFGLVGLSIIGLCIKGLICKEYYDANENEEIDEKNENNETINQ